MSPADAAPLDAEGFRRASGVSRETLGRLQDYLELLILWNRRINLVSRASLADPWRRHLLDSAQLLPLLPHGARVLVDLGSGAGLPGLVLAILGVPRVHLVEADQRKAAFLREAARVAAASVTIHPERIEAIPSFPADVVTARALAPLPRLIELSRRFLAPHGVCLFLKGRNAAEELTAAHKAWKMRAQRLPSATDAGAGILRLEPRAP